MRDVLQAGDQWIPQADYDLILARVPVLCTDVLIRDAGDPDRIALIYRDTPDGPAWCMTGGRVLRDEPLEHAVRRHIRATLGPSMQIVPDGLSQAGVFEYFTTPGPGALHDPRKHAVAVTYMAACHGQLVPQGEADEARWFRRGDLPDIGTGFGHGDVITRILSHGRSPGSAAG